MGEAEVEGFAAAVGGCSTVGELIVGSVDTEVPEGLAACISDNVDRDAFMDLLARQVIYGYSADREVPVELMAGVIEACPDFAGLRGG